VLLFKYEIYLCFVSFCFTIIELFLEMMVSHFGITSFAIHELVDFDGDNYYFFHFYGVIFIIVM